MGNVEFLDKGFERAIRKVIGTSQEWISSEDLKEINGILIAEGNRSGFGIPWHADSSAFQMTFPDLMFNVVDSENGKWELDLIYFSHIRTLHIYVPTEDLTFLSDFTNLRELYVENSKAQNWAFLQNLINLCFLYLRECTFHDLTPILDLYRNQERVPKSNELLHRLNEVRLSHLGLNYCGISDITPLAECKSIEDLNLSHNIISDISPLRTISSLYYLTLRYNQITDISPLRDLRWIYYINVRHNQISDISELSRMKSKNISRLFLGHNPINDYSPACQLRLVAQDIEGYREQYNKAKGWVSEMED